MQLPLALQLQLQQRLHGQPLLGQTGPQRWWGAGRGGCWDGSRGLLLLQQLQQELLLPHLDQGDTVRASGLALGPGPAGEAQPGAHLLAPKQLLFFLPPFLLLLLLLLPALLLPPLALLLLPLRPELHFSALLELAQETRWQSWGHPAFPASVRPLPPQNPSPTKPTHFVLQLELF